MLQDFNHHIETNLSYLKNKKILIAISGGVDSVVLTHLMQQLNFNISLAHCNFQLRGNESDLDESSINKLSKELSIKAFIIRFDTNAYSKKNKLSTQIAARKLRYDFFEKLINEHEFDYVLTAHHADDNLETFLINLTRGTGLEGLTGIPEKNGNIIRPLLHFSRANILLFAKENNITWREDKSNSEQKYLRNKLRHAVVPVLKEINPSLLTSFNKTSTYLQESLAIVNDKIKEVSREIIIKEGAVLKFDIQKITNLPNPKAYLYQLLKECNFKEWNKVYELLNAQSGKYLRTNSHVLLKDRDFLVLSLLTKSEVDLEEVYYIEENLEGNNSFPINIELSNEKKVEGDLKKSILVDKNLVFYPLVVRKWQRGDFFYPSGMHGKKKISKYFKDEKLSLLEKQNIWLLCNKENQIIWVMGLRQDRRFQINDNTKSIIKISI